MGNKLCFYDTSPIRRTYLCLNLRPLIKFKILFLKHISIIRIGIPSKIKLIRLCRRVQTHLLNYRIKILLPSDYLLTQCNKYLLLMYLYTGYLYYVIPMIILIFFPRIETANALGIILSSCYSSNFACTPGFHNFCLPWGIF